MRLPAAVLVLALAGCDGIQSAMSPHGRNAEVIASLAWVLFIAAGLIFLFVLALAGFLMIAPAERRRYLAGPGLIIGIGLVFPVVVLSLLLVFTLPVGDALTTAAAGRPLRIEVVGRMWWWEVRYPEGPDGAAVVAANELHFPVGRPVELALSTRDVIHSFWIPALGGKLDMIPGHVTVLRLQADAAGTFRGQCAEFCGAQHANMGFFAVAHAPDEFESWLTGQRRPAAPPGPPFLQRGRELFLSAGCGGCHRVRGTGAEGTIGPDLTHVGSRVSIGAGMLPTNAGTIAGWIADTQHIKPTSTMPSFGIFAGPELRAIAAYLESLK
jgi:cytochrome c oxidase subunit II